MSRTEAQMQKSCLAFPCQVPHTVGILVRTRTNMWLAG